MSTTTATLPDTLTLGPTALTVRDVGRSAGFYENVIGLDTLERSDERAVMGSGGRPVLELVAEPGATRCPGARPACTTWRCSTPHARSWRTWPSG